MDHALHAAPPLWQRQVEHDDSLVRLPAGATLARHLAAGACITVQRGRVWLTQSGDANDYFVSAGERHVVARPGRVVIEGDSPLAALQVSASAPGARLGCP